MCDCVHTGGCQRTCHLCIQSLLSIFFEVGSLTLHCISQPGWHTSFLGFSWLHHSSCIGELGLQRLTGITYTVLHGFCGSNSGPHDSMQVFCSPRWFSRPEFWEEMPDFFTKTTPFYLIASKCGETFDLPTPLPNLLCNTNYKLSLWLWFGFSLWFWFPFSQWLMLTPIVKKNPSQSHDLQALLPHLFPILQNY